MLIGSCELNLDDIDADKLEKIVKEAAKRRDAKSKIDRAVGRVATLHPFLGERNIAGVELLGGSYWPHQVVLQNLESL